ncbi:capsule biosynthesis protein CapI [Roseivirga sp. 4D4]|uniref:NAD-dependent epimerase n=1 Tax=Roseivirga sp. 4D4 TaxID=1889784 RepID=UPI000853DFD9|nr:NAD-dependent epimerase [Roseivirga sp. 4D4]OEK02511.1 capsule biosynthesis protein CapI [Roseivirga sp. 4D4]
MAKVLITGTAGFIGFHLARKLLNRGDQVFGLDSINDYYDLRVKYGRLGETGIKKDAIEYNTLVQSTKYPNYKFVQLQLEDSQNLTSLFKKEKFDTVINLAAQAGVRYSLENPRAYIDSNIIGFMNILEACRHHGVKHLSYASSSSVYGLNETRPFSVQHNVDHPISLYAASKKSNELMAHTYSHLFGLPTTGLRFFTVYGPWGRPDMALFLFTKAILDNEPINIFNNGNMSRDFTYVDDIVEGITRVNDNPPQGNANWTGKNPDPSTSIAPYTVYNIGNNAPVKLMDFISIIEKCLDKIAQKNFMPMQAGDVSATYADVQSLIENLGYKPNTPLETGVTNFIDWYKEFYNVR